MLGTVDAQVVTWTPGADLLTPVTRGGAWEEYPYATPDGPQVVFNRRLELPPPEFRTGLYPRSVCVADLPGQ